jgi:hypothetical protein
MRGLTFEKPKKRYSLSECYANFLTILRIYRTTMIFYINYNPNYNSKKYKRKQKLQFTQELLIDY